MVWKKTKAKINYWLLLLQLLLKSFKMCWENFAYSFGPGMSCLVSSVAPYLDPQSWEKKFRQAVEEGRKNGSVAWISDRDWNKDKFIYLTENQHST